MKSLRRVEIIQEYMKEQGSVAVAFSGGVDSTFLLYIAKEALGENVLAITLNGTAMPDRDMEDVVDFLHDEEIKHEIIKVDQLAIEGFKENNPDRCYVCKKALFTKIKEVAAEHGIEHVIDGTNFDDALDYRPGMKALKELGIESPLLELHITKRDVREWSEWYGLKTAYKPASPCLATRIKTGEEITEEKLRMIEQTEDYILERGFSQVRVRMIGNNASVEVRKDQVENLIKSKDEVEAKLKEIGFENVEINPDGYKMGRMNR